MLSCRWRVWTEDGIGQLRTITNKVASFCGGIGFEMGIKFIRKLFMDGKEGHWTGWRDSYGERLLRVIDFIIQVGLIAQWHVLMA